MKKARSRQEQAVVASRLAAGVQLQNHRPKTHATGKTYNRTKAKRLWQKDQEALSSCLRPFQGAPAGIS